MYNANATAQASTEPTATLSTGFRRTYFQVRVTGPAGLARITLPERNRSISVPRSATLWYRRTRSFSSAFSTMVSTSPPKIRLTVEGFFGCDSRIRRIASMSAASRTS